MECHYEFVPGDEIIIAPGRTLKRIRSLVAIEVIGVSVGDVGGYVEKIDNLSGNAWVSGNALVSGNARVFGNAMVSGDAWVFGNARVFGKARVYGDAQVFGKALVSGNAQVSGDALVSGNAHVFGNADHLIIGPAKSSGRFTTAHKDQKLGVRVNCGYFSGTVVEFSKQIESTHKGNKEHLEQYRLFCQLIAFNFNVTE